MINDNISPSPIIGQTTHEISCGCNECFNMQLKSIKQLSAKTIGNLIDNFIKYKTKGQYGNLKNHPNDCKCVDHLIEKHASETRAINNLLQKMKQEQSTKGATSKKPNIKQKPPPKPNTTKISRDNVLHDRTPSTPK